MSETLALPHQLAHLAPRLQHNDATVRRIALIELADEEDEAGLPWLLQTLANDPASVVRLEAANRLAGWEQPAVVLGLAQALLDSDGAVRDAAALSLSQLKTAAAGRHLLPLLQQQDEFVQLSLLRALRELRLAEAAPAALAQLSAASPALRREAVGVLGWLKYQPALPALCQLAVADDDAEVRRASTGAIGLGSSAEVLAALLQALNDADWLVREEAAATLGKLRLDGALSGLIAALDDDYWQVRVRVARALGRLQLSRATKPLLQALTHSVSNLRKEAALALAEIGDSSALPGLQRASDDPDPEVRKAARLAVSQLLVNQP